jgi:2-methylfumaryl-CoA isomerase
MQLLQGLRVVEGSAFVAAPLGGLTLAQLGADVIRFDTIGGGLDYQRWPVTEEGVSLYWAGLNKGKRSIAIDLSRPEGRELATDLITAPGEDAGIFLSNFPGHGWLSDERLRERRPDLVYLNIIGNPDESTAVDYTVNAASGIALATGPVGSLLPVNHALPAWDIATGLNAVIGILAAERHRRITGEGQFVRLSLADVAFTLVANLGFLAQAQVSRENRPTARQRHVRRVRSRLRDEGRSPRHGRRHLAQPVADARAGDRHRGTPAADGTRVPRRLHPGAGPLPRA